MIEVQRSIVVTIISISLVLIAACEKKSGNSSLNEHGKSALVERGQTVYITVCTTCHNMDPRLDGVVGPAVAGSSLELLEARVLNAKYPEGYKPKRETKQMVALPQFKNDLPAIHAYLNSLK